MTIRRATPLDVTRIVEFGGTEYLVRRYTIIGTNHVVHRVYERASLMGGWYSLYRHEGEYYGEIVSRQLPHDINRLPYGSDHRHNAIMGHTQMLAELSYAILEHAFVIMPADEATYDNGEISYHVDALQLTW